MIDAAEVLKNLKLPAADETEVQRLGAEIIAALRSPSFDGRPAHFAVPVGEGEEQLAKATRIACALQRRFQARGWAVNVEQDTDGFGALSAYRLVIMLDGAALRQQPRSLAAPDAPESAIPPTPAVTPLRALYNELAGFYGVSGTHLPKDPEISVILGTYNRIELLKRAIESVRKAVGGLSYEIVVTDGGSQDGSRAWLAAQPDVLLVGERRLDGAVKAFSQAFSLSRGLFVANFNDDAVYHAGVLAEGVKHLEKNPKCGQVAFGVADRGKDVTVNDVYPGVPGTTYANFGLIRRDVVDKIAVIQSGFWNGIYRTYAGDCELSAWVWKLGHTVDKRPDLLVDDVWYEDGLRKGNSDAMTVDTKRFYARWPAEAFKPGGLKPRVTPAEWERFESVVCGSNTAALPRVPVDEEPVESTQSLMADLCEFPLPEEEPRVAKIGNVLTQFDPVEGQFQKRVEKLPVERVLHVSLCTDADPQAGLVRALKKLSTGGGYGEVRWLADYGYDAKMRHDFIIESAITIKPTLIFIQTQAPGAVTVETIRELREVSEPSCVIVLWNGDVAGPNAISQIAWQIELGRAVDLNLNASMTHVRAMRSAGAHNSAWLNIGYDDEQYRLVNHPVKYDYDVCFLGSRYSNDHPLLSTVSKHDGDLRDAVILAMKQRFGERFGLFGNGWAEFLRQRGIDHVDRVVPLAEAHEVYWRSRVGLSISLDNTLEAYSSDRLHRILGCGTLALIKSFPKMSSWGLEHWKNCAVWNTPLGAVDAVRWMAVDDEEQRNCVEAQAEAGAYLARERLTWDARMLELSSMIAAVRSTR